MAFTEEILGELLAGRYKILITYETSNAGPRTPSPITARPLELIFIAHCQNRIDLSIR
jgi:hypothetical protein